MKRPFLLTKWYLDAVSDDGDAVIVYAAELVWRGVRVRYNSALRKHGATVDSLTAIQHCSLPSQSGDAICLDIQSLSLAGTWTADAVPVTHNVYESADGDVTWNCLQPRSRVRIRAGELEFDGLGYVECLTLTIPPWRLPMSELRWGRFTSAQDSVAWVDWKGPFSNRFAIHNGELSVPEVVSDSHLALPALSLDMEEGFTLRDGELRTSVLRNAPALAKLLPQSLFGVREHKWLSRGLCRAAGRTSSGWIIHEVVHWTL